MEDFGGDDERAYFSFLNKGKYEMFLKVDYDWNVLWSSVTVFFQFFTISKFIPNYRLILQNSPV